MLAPARLNAIEASRLLDSPPESAFDQLTSLAATLLDAPYAFTTIVDGRRSFWKSSIGVDAGDDRQHPVEESFCQYVVGSDAELIVGDATSDPRTRDHPSIASMGVVAWAGFPLRAPGGEVLGSFCVGDQRPRDWSDRDVAILRVLSSAAAGEVALRNALQRAEALAATLQESLLPPVLSSIPGLDLAAGYRPAGGGTELVGDFYDVYPLEAGRWSIAIGDVCGKGVEAAKTTALARHSLAAASLRSDSPSDVLRVLDETLRSHQPNGAFVTAIFGWIRQEGHHFHVELAAAGHPPALIVRRDGTVSEATRPGTLLGVLPALELIDCAFNLHPGDTLVMYTDGITEARRGGELYGEERLSALLSDNHDLGAAALIACIEHTVADYGGVALDDRAILAIRAPEEPARLRAAA